MKSPPLPESFQEEPKGVNPVPFPFLFSKVPSTVATTIVPSPLVVRAGDCYIEGSSVVRPAREVVLVFKTLLLYTALFL